MSFTTEESAAVLRAVRGCIDLMTEEVVRLHSLSNGDGDYYRKLADLKSEEIKRLEGAVRKIWVQQLPPSK